MPINPSKKPSSWTDKTPTTIWLPGRSHLQRRASSESISYLTKYRGQRPKDPRGHLALGAAYYQAGQLGEAQQELRLACDSSETASAAHYYLGRAALQTDDFEMAVRELESALAGESEKSRRGRGTRSSALRTKNYRLAEQTLAESSYQGPGSLQSKPASPEPLPTNARRSNRRAGAKVRAGKKARSDREQSLLRRVEFIK